VEVPTVCGDALDRRDLLACRHEWPFEVEIKGSIAESIEGLTNSHISYKLKATITRGRLGSALHAYKPVRVVRAWNLAALDRAGPTINHQPSITATINHQSPQPSTITNINHHNHDHQPSQSRPSTITITTINHHNHDHQPSTITLCKGRSLSAALRNQLAHVIYGPSEL
jgi:hypothetical protein